MAKPILFLSFLLLSGCMVGPKYRKPAAELPAQFEEQKAAEPSEEDFGHWWQRFQDPLLDALIEEALAANYDLRLAFERIEQARAQYRIERSYLWPEIDLNASASRSRISQNLFSPSAPASSAAAAPNAAAPSANASGSFLPAYLNLFQLGLDAIWELDLFGKFRHAEKAACDLAEASFEDAESVLISLVSEVAVNYVNLRALQEEMDLIEQQIALDGEELEITRSLVQSGLATELQLDSLLAQLGRDEASKAALENSLKQTFYALSLLLGRAPEGFAPLFRERAPIPSAWDRIPVGLPSDLLRRRPDIKSAERHLAAATEQVGEAIADLFPHIALTGISLGAGNKVGSSYGYASSKWHSLLSSPSRMFSTGIGINWNLLDFGRVRAHIDLNRSLERQALLIYERTVIGALNDVESALAAYFSEEQRQLFLEQILAANRGAWEITEQRARIGLATRLDVLNARKVVLEAEMNLIQSRQSLTGDLIAVYKALGGSWEESIARAMVEEQSAHFDPHSRPPFPSTL